MSNQPKIFGGEHTREFWHKIGALNEQLPGVHEALYWLGCKCQELEAEVASLRERLDGQDKAKVKTTAPRLGRKRGDEDARCGKKR